jgi:hypothetical protein
MDGKSLGTEFTLRGLWSSDFVRPKTIYEEIIE